MDILGIFINILSTFQGVEGGLIGCLKNFRASSRPTGEPTYIEGTEPCSSKVESGSFFALEGGYIKAGKKLLTSFWMGIIIPNFFL